MSLVLCENEYSFANRNLLDSSKCHIHWVVKAETALHIAKGFPRSS